MNEIIPSGRSAVEGDVIDATRGRSLATPAFVPRADIRVRPGTLDDLPFVDAMQKKHSRELGFLPTAALEGKVRLGEVLIAEEVGSSEWGVGRKAENASPSLLSPHSQLPTPHSPIAYLIAADRYFKRDEVGYVTQINVLPEYRRTLVAASLLQAQFDRSAYGCKLYSCWCAQDLKANAFWEAMGFTAIAFRTGSRTRGKGRGARGEEAGTSSVGAHAGSDATSSPRPSPLPPRPSGHARIHLFWQKRIRAGDTTTPWWYPAQTGGGALREDRLVFPIPPGTHWRDVLPVVLPEEWRVNESSGAVERVKAIEAEEGEAPTPKFRKTRGPDETREEWLNRIGRARYERALANEKRPRLPGGGFVTPPPEPTELEKKLVDPEARLAAREAIRERMRKHPPAVPTKPAGAGPVWHVPDYNDYRPTTVEVDQEIAASLSDERKRAEKQRAARAAKKAAATIDPRITALAREMRDRWLESSHAILPTPAKHAVGRQIESTPTMPQLGQAA